MPDNAAEFLLRAGKKTRNVFKRDERNIESITEAHEARAFYGCVDVEHACEECRLIGDDSDGAAFEAREADDKVFCKMLVDFEEFALVSDIVDCIFNVIGFLRILGYQRIQCGGGSVPRIA